MKRYLHLIFILLALLIPAVACNQAKVVKAKDTKYSTQGNKRTEKQQVYLIGESIIRDRTDNDLVWNIEKLDTNEYWVYEGHFVNTSVKNKLVLLGGKAGESAGTEDNLLILFDAKDPKKILWAGQTGDILKEQVKDLNGDGITEVVVTKSNTYMGECSEIFEIISFRKAKREILFSKRSWSVIDCGSQEVWKMYKMGDTLQAQYVHELVSVKDNVYQVREKGLVKIHAGGSTDKEMKAKLITGENAWNYNLR